MRKRRRKRRKRRRGSSSSRLSVGHTLVSPARVVWRQEAEVPGQPAHTNPSLKQNTQSPMSQSRSSDT